MYGAVLERCLVSSSDARRLWALGWSSATEEVPTGALLDELSVPLSYGPLLVARLAGEAPFGKGSSWDAVGARVARWL